MKQTTFDEFVDLSRRGTFVPVVGAVNMDLVTLDLTDATVSVGGTVTLLAGRADRGPTVVELAERAGTTPYEILCHFGLRLPHRAVASGAAPSEHARREAIAG